MAKIYLSVDGGGTKTEFCIYDVEADKYFTEIYTGSNYKYETGDEEIKYTLSEQCVEAIEKHGYNVSDVAGAVFGMSGIDSEKDLEYYRDIVKNTGIPMERIIICNDCEYGLRGNTEKDGMAVLVGTGSIVYGICEGHVHRTAGWGPPYSDLGSGTWMGAEVLKEAILRLDEGADESDPIVGLVSEFKEEGVPLQWSLSLLDIPSTARPTKAMLKLAEEGNPTCQEIVLEAAYHVAGYVLTNFKKMNYKGDELDMVYIGGVTKNAYFRRVFEPIAQNMLKIKLNWILPEDSAARTGINYVMREIK